MKVGNCTLKIFAFLFLFVFTKAGDSNKGQEIFQTKCTSCHKLSEEKLVGPGLKGVTKRRNLEWLKRQIMTPDVLVKEGDPIATQLVKEYGVPMANLGITEEEAEHLIAFFKKMDEGEAPLSAEGTQISSAMWISIIVGFLAIFLITIVALKAGQKRVIPFV